MVQILYGPAPWFSFVQEAILPIFQPLKIQPGPRTYRQRKPTTEAQGRRWGMREVRSARQLGRKPGVIRRTGGREAQHGDSGSFYATCSSKLNHVAALQIYIHCATRHLNRTKRNNFLMHRQSSHKHYRTQQLDPRPIPVPQERLWTGEVWRWGCTHMTAHWAKERYSTRTSRPLFSSLRNSLTHLCKQKGVTKPGAHPGVHYRNIKVERKKTIQLVLIWLSRKCIKKKKRQKVGGRTKIMQEMKTIHLNKEMENICNERLFKSTWH